MKKTILIIGALVLIIGSVGTYIILKPESPSQTVSVQDENATNTLATVTPPAVATSTPEYVAVATSSIEGSTSTGTTTAKIHTDLGDFTDVFYGLILSNVTATSSYYEVQIQSEGNIIQQEYDHSGKIVLIEDATGYSLQPGRMYLFSTDYNTETNAYTVQYARTLPQWGDQ